ncbi:MAG TPA: prepilin-type N-terminal cleavage/methylation domain-containing protein [Gemmatimonadales bacterium]|nr:prepilin-type N-terminal cleavage/methylation domain-containing protein [Gemmatimonadales bacterium]
MRYDRKGFTLVEIIVAMAILAIFLVGLAKANYVILHRLNVMSGGAARDAVLMQLENQFTAMPFDSLKKKAGTISVTSPPFSYTRTITVDTTVTNRRKVTITITPTNTMFKSGTITLTRSKPAASPIGT